MGIAMLIVTWLGYLFALIGFAATIYKSVEVWLNLKVLSWNDVDKYSRKVINEVRASGFKPDVIVTIGRGGAVFGAVLSGNTSAHKEKHKQCNIPLLGADRMYKWEDNCRWEIPNDMISFAALAGKKVLLVAGDVLSGGTMKFHFNQLKEAGIEDIQTACLVKGVSSTLHPDYFGKEILADFRMPWMYKGYGYVRDSRRPLVPQHPVGKA